MGTSQRAATLFVRCAGVFLVLLAVTSCLARLLMSPVMEGGPGTGRGVAALLWGAMTYGVIGVAVLVLNRPLGWLLARGLDE